MIGRRRATKNFTEVIFEGVCYITRLDDVVFIFMMQHRHTRKSCLFSLYVHIHDLV